MTGMNHSKRQVLFMLPFLEHTPIHWLMFI